MATQQTVPHVVGQSKLAVVIPIPQPSPEPISQNELALLLSLRGRLQQLEEQVESAEQSIRQRLEGGAVVEPGDHIARIEEQFRANIAWKEKAIDLAERLSLNCRAWVQQVLSHTTKTRTSSLSVA